MTRIAPTHWPPGKNVINGNCCIPMILLEIEFRIYRLTEEMNNRYIYEPCGTDVTVSISPAICAYTVP